MSDATPDYRFETMKLERQAKSIRLTVLDQKVQIAAATDERAHLRSSRKELEHDVPEPLKEGSEKEQLQRQWEIERAELAVFDVDLRLVELDGIIKRLQGNITASDKALEELDATIAGMKEGNNIG